MTPMEVNTELNAIKAKFEEDLKALALKAAVAVKEASDFTARAVNEMIIPVIDKDEQIVVNFVTNGISKLGQSATVKDLENAILGLLNMTGLGGLAPTDAKGEPSQEAECPTGTCDVPQEGHSD